MRVKDIAKLRGREVITVGPNEKVSEAVKKLVDHRIGAMPVCDADGMPVGIISERDILRGLHQYKKDVSDIKVKDLMTRDVSVGVLEDEISSILQVMKEKGIRHLPVMVGSRIAGMLSIRDIIEGELTACNKQVRDLHDYITGGYA